MKKYMSGNTTVIEMTLEGSLSCNVLWEQKVTDFSGLVQKRWFT